jgi:hypothetical protein
MYQYLTIAPNASERGVSKMYLYKNLNNNMIYISQMYPFSATFTGGKLTDDTTYYAIYEPLEVTQSDISKGMITYWSQNWIVKL